MSFVEACALIDQGVASVRPQTRRRIPAGPSPAGAWSRPLTRYELAVIDLISRSLTNEQIAAHLGCTPGAITHLVTTAMAVTGTRTRVALVAACFRAGVIT